MQNKNTEKTAPDLIDNLMEFPKLNRWLPVLPSNCIIFISQHFLPKKLLLAQRKLALFNDRNVALLFLRQSVKMGEFRKAQIRPIKEKRAGVLEVMENVIKIASLARQVRSNIFASAEHKKINKSFKWIAVCQSPKLGRARGAIENLL